MDNNTEYMTIKQFADAANVSTQRLYKLYATGCTTDCNGIATELHKHFKLVNGKKYIHRDALKLFDNATELHNVAQPSATDNATAQAAITALEKQLEVLQQQLTVKDEQIKELQAALRTAQEQQTALTTALTQQQALHAGTIQQQLEQRSDAPTASEREPSSDAVNVPDQEEPQQQQGTFLSRLFSKMKKKT